MIPDGWSEVRLGEVIHFEVGYPFDSAQFHPFDGVRLIRNSDLKSDASVVCVRGSYPASFLVADGDLLVGMDGDFIPVRWKGGKALLNQRVGRVRTTSKCDVVYMSYALVAPLRKIEEITSATTVKHLSHSDVVGIRIAIPPIREQHAIAEALSDADALVESLDALIAKKRDMKQAAMQQLLTGRTRLPGFTGEWQELRIGDVGRCLRGVSYNPQRDLSDRDTETTVRLLRSNNVQQSLLNFDDVQFVEEARVSEEQILIPGDVVVCMANGSRALVGKSGLFRGNDEVQHTFGAFMGCFRTDAAKAAPGFVRFLFLTKRYFDYISNLLAGSAINNLAPSSIESLRFDMPPLAEQQAIAEILSDMDAEADALVAQREKAELVKQGMMQELLSGRVRLL